jgi:hypothetical protein
LAVAVTVLPVVVLAVLQVLTLRSAVLHLPVAVVVQLKPSTLGTEVLEVAQIVLLLETEILLALHRLKEAMAAHRLVHPVLLEQAVAVHLRLEQILQVAQ